MEYSEAAAINNQGNVAGTAYKGQETCAFHYSYKFMLDAGGLNSRAFGINSTNLVVGDAFIVVPMEPPQWNLEATLRCSKVESRWTWGFCQARCTAEPMASTPLGQVVGFSGPERDSIESRAFVWSSQTGMMDIGTLGGSYAQAYAINDAGFITGTSQTLGYCL